jgi:hypothetical protein
MEQEQAALQAQQIELQNKLLQLRIDRLQQHKLYALCER